MPIEHYQRTLPFSRIPIIHPAIFYDDGEGAFNYTIEGTGTDYSASHQAEAALTGSKGIKLATRSINQASSDAVQITKHLHLGPTKRLRIQLAFAHHAATPVCELNVYLHWFTGTHEYLAGLTFLKTSSLVQYWAIPAGWNTIPDLTYITHPLSWNSVDLTLDLLKHRYSHLLINEYAVDLKAIAIPVLEPVEPKRVDFLINLKTLAAATARAYIDQILLTAETL